MTNIINNIGKLRSDLIRHDWHMTAFPFTYNGVGYDVLFENNDNLYQRINPYASVTLHFIDNKNLNRIYDIEANQVRMFFNPKEFREFFGIKYVENLGNVFQQFFNRFLEFVPPVVPNNLSQQQNNEIDKCLAARGGHNPNAIYCYDARRLGKQNGRQMHRSLFISNLTQRRNPILYQYFQDEKTVTFYFSPNPNDARNDREIIHSFSIRESNHGR